MTLVAEWVLATSLRGSPAQEERDPASWTEAELRVPGRTQRGAWHRRERNGHRHFAERDIVETGSAGGAAIMTGSALLDVEPEPDPRVWRGVFVVDAPRKVLFTKRVHVKIADLPRWKPHIVIDRRTLERGDG